MDEESALKYARDLYQDVLHAWYEGDHLVVERGITVRVARKDGKYVPNMGRSIECSKAPRRIDSKVKEEESSNQTGAEAVTYPDAQKQAGRKKAPKGTWKLLP